VAFGQIQTNIGDFEEKLAVPNGEHDGYMGPDSRFFIGNFHFQSMPKPLEPCKVDFVLEVSKEEPLMSADDWDIRLEYNCNAVRIISDTAFHWFGPHKVESRFTGILEFIPLRSGDWGITLYCYRPAPFHISEQIAAGIGFRWCLSPEGELRYLDKGPAMPEDCRSIRSTFFKGDSIIIYDDPERVPDEPFEYKIVVEPVPRIGDTANIHFFLKARQDVSSGCDLRIDMGSMVLLSQPAKMNFPVEKGQIIDYAFRVVPCPVRNGHGITLHLSCDHYQPKRYKYSQTIQCSLIFNNDSTLRYVNYEDYNYEKDHVESVKGTLFPDVFPWATSSDNKHIEIKGDSIKTY